MRHQLLGVFLLVSLAFVAANTNLLSEVTCLLVRQVDGTCNNPFNHALGAADRYLARGAEGVWYADGVREPILTPNPRTVSNALFRANDSITSPHNHNLLWTFFGQFIAHDMMGVHRKGDVNISEIPDSNNPDVWIRIPTFSGDAFYTFVPPLTTPYIRVLKSRGDVVNGRFEVGSDSTAFLDLDTVYGKSVAVSKKLRTFQNGLLASRIYNNYTAFNGTAVASDNVGNWGEWLPLLVDVDPNREVVPVSPQLVGATTANIPQRFFGTGDGRNGENYALNMFQGLFLREHNRIARKIKQDNPFFNDEFIFQLARRLNIAQYQAVVMYEFLPSLLLNDYSQVGSYQVYDHRADPTVTQLFAFAFRFGHTTVPDTFTIKNKCNQRPFNNTRDAPRSGQQSATFMPADMLALVGDPNNILHSILFENSRRVDVQFPESLRSIRGANTDIIVQNQVRASENGIPSYHVIRKLWYGGATANLYQLPGCNVANENTPAPDPIACFNYINSNATVASILQEQYGKINNINFYTSVVAEEPTLSAVGRTSARIIADQFKRARAGDRWWFENPTSGFLPSERRNIKNTKMHDLLRRNFPTASVQTNAFYSPPASFYAC